MDVTMDWSRGHVTPSVSLPLAKGSGSSKASSFFGPQTNVTVEFLPAAAPQCLDFARLCFRTALSPDSPSPAQRHSNIRKIDDLQPVTGSAWLLTSFLYESLTSGAHRPGWLPFINCLLSLQKGACLLHRNHPLCGAETRRMNRAGLLETWLQPVLVLLKSVTYETNSQAQASPGTWDPALPITLRLTLGRYPSALETGEVYSSIQPSGSPPQVVCWRLLLTREKRSSLRMCLLKSTFQK